MNFRGPADHTEVKPARSVGANAIPPPGPKQTIEGSRRQTAGRVPLLGRTTLDELIRSSAAQNRYIGIEHLTEEELDELRAKCETRAKASKLQAAHEAGERASKKANKKAARAARGVS